MKKAILIGVSILVLVAVVLLLVSGRPSDHPDQPRRGPAFLGDLPGIISDFYAPFFGSVSKTRSGFQNVGENLKSLDVMQVENRALSEQNSLLKMENERLREMVRENDRLRDMLGFMRNSPFELAAARIIARDASIWWQGLMLDKGFAEVPEMESNTAVITPDGLVGKITTVFKNSARMLMIIDENCKVSAVIPENGEHGVVMGTRESNELNPVLRMSYISRKADVRPGMAVVTSGLGGVFPPGIRIGTITEVREVKTSGTLGLYKEASIRPAVNLANLEYAFILVDVDKKKPRR
ncbi:rod shape-determining protein MreC [Kamptonema cortianum]|nr:rod shape-determining protein MreC [Kamptonema cortianum]MDL5048070.1 rod shape-determining protein MreC [Oscillatoria amoena NRMC-F 0135]